MGKKRKSSSVAAESIFPLAPQPAASGNPFPEGTIGYAEHQKEHTNPFQFGTIGWTDWQRDHGLSTAPPPVDPKTGKGYLPSGDYTSGDAATDAFAKTLKKDDLWRFQKMEEHMAGKTLEGAMPPKTGSIYEDFKGPLEFLRSAGVAQKSTGGGDVENLTRELTELSNRGVQFGNKAMKNAGQINKMAPDLARWGVKSLNDLQAFDIPGRGTIYYNKGNNTVLPADFGSSMHGEGGTYFSLKNINGHVLPTTEWTDTSDRQAIMGGLSVLGAAAGLGGLGAAIGGATGLGTAGGNALVGAGMGGLQSAAGGGNFLKGALMGGLGGAVSALNPAGALGVTNPTLQAGLNSALSGGLRGISGNFVGRIKGAKCPFDLQFLTARPATSPSRSPAAAWLLRCRLVPSLIRVSNPLPPPPCAFANAPSPASQICWAESLIAWASWVSNRPGDEAGFFGAEGWRFVTMRNPSLGATGERSRRGARTSVGSGFGAHSLIRYQPGLARARSARRGRGRAALAHLLYGLDGGGGFVVLTGEIGAGKTTVCRCFLEQVPPNCDVAYIVNPKVTVIELLRSVCDELGIAVAPSAPPTVKDHVDPLNRFLLAAHAAGRHCVLVIDEAQNLSADVLEQLRLLTNLETDERKLLQILLIGQPELRALLARPELEQLAQRVIARRSEERRV